jgi:1-deoxy-D-xylulose-5-phosphate reductoisomerase
MDADIVIAGIVGLAGLKPIMAAINRGARIGLANKEAMICAGQLLTLAAKKSGAEIIPIDSEHNAIFQVFDFKNPRSIEKVILTASGGPFRQMPLKDLSKVTPEQATAHPNWKMGAKISVDSATMVNKGLELIEAYNLFPLKPEQLEVVIHPESIMHSLVYYNDGAVLSTSGVPDMRVPISYVLGYPERLKNNVARLDLVKTGSLNFEKPDYARFPGLKLAEEVLRASQSAHIVFNAANEVAVEKFLKREIAFTDIAKIIAESLAKHKSQKINSLADVFTLDAEIRNSLIPIAA